MVDAFIPEHALSANAEAALIHEITGLLRKLKELVPSNQKALDVSAFSVHRPRERIDGVRTQLPFYLLTWEPESQYSANVRATAVREMTAVFARAERSRIEEIASRLWVFPREVAEECC
jgi:hypothetical protein